MSVLCTFPGKYGDLLWALPTIRAIARRTGEAVDLLTSADMASICPLISQQDYIGHCFARKEWVRVHIDKDDRLPPFTLTGYQHIVHLGYRGWPQRPLPFETKDCYNDQILNASPTQHYLLDEELDLKTPWITVQTPSPFHVYAACGFSDDHFELKYGLFELLSRELEWTRDIGGNWVSVSGCHGSRWRAEGHHECDSWLTAARAITASSVFLGCNSGLHVLALAIGKPVVMMEPSEARWNPIFFPFGPGGPEVTLVRGNDDQPTWDARHVADALKHTLNTVRTVQRS